jgi:hypothetical protein
VIIFDRNDNNRKIKSGLQNILALNINSYMGGANGMWNSNRNGLSYAKKQKFKNQTFNDNNLEFMSWNG